MNLRTACLLSISFFGNPLAADESPAMVTGDHDHAASHHYPDPLGFSLTEGWLDPWPHTHFSRGGTPFIHTFGLEPAYLDRDLFFDFAFVRGEDEDEFETEVELEWALTRPDWDWSSRFLIFR